jgi:hypothetical protein
MKEAKIEVAFMNKNPKENPISYHIETIQDIADCVTMENVDGFLTDFELSIKSYLLAKSLLEEQINKGEMPKDAKVKFPSFTWIDDWKKIIINNI